MKIKQKNIKFNVEKLLNQSRNFSCTRPLPPSVKEKKADNLLLKRETINEKPTHKTAHLQAPTH